MSSTPQSRRWLSLFFNSPSPDLQSAGASLPEMEKQNQAQTQQQPVSETLKSAEKLATACELHLQRIEEKLGLRRKQLRDIFPHQSPAHP